MAEKSDKPTKPAAPGSSPDNSPANYVVLQPFYLGAKLCDAGKTVELTGVEADYLGKQVQPAPTTA